MTGFTIEKDPRFTSFDRPVGGLDIRLENIPALAGVETADWPDSGPVPQRGVFFRSPEGRLFGILEDPYLVERGTAKGPQIVADNAEVEGKNIYAVLGEALRLLGLGPEAVEWTHGLHTDKKDQWLKGPRAKSVMAVAMDTSLTRDAKVAEIMTLIGMSPREVEAARSNYARLSDMEIDRRLGILRAGEKVVKEWRRTRGLAAPKLQAG